MNANWQNEKWECIGRRVLEKQCNHFDHDDSMNNVEYQGWCEKCEIYEDDGYPMINEIYPLLYEPTDDEVLKVLDAGLTVMYDNEADEYCMALCGGGMDLSQNIGLAYIHTRKHIPMEWLFNINTQKELSVYGDDWNLLKKEMQKELKFLGNRAKQQLKIWEDN